MSEISTEELADRLDNARVFATVFPDRVMTAQKAAARLRSQAAEIERLQRSLAILSLRVLQSELVLDEKELAARDWGVELQCAALAQTKEQDHGD